ncbi:hypothetical protein V9L05_15185 [Bernardetia sp. Wsw4-3y2]|uniref:hypothetical protein n=1 Tax=Bernardetia sp. Wsw4-3y2 TaxID=3127471 RepID=UPI0030D14987
MLTMQVEKLENFKYQDRIIPIAYRAEGRTFWRNQIYPDFLVVNEPFYRDTQHCHAKRMFWLSRKEIHFEGAFRAKMKKTTKGIKADYKQGVLQRTDTPCRWELKIYYKSGKNHPLYYSFGDDNTFLVVNYFLTEIFKRIDPESDLAKIYPNQKLRKAMIFDRHSDECVFEYPSKNFNIQSVGEVRKQFDRIVKHFKKFEDFPTYEQYSDDEWVATPKVLANSQTEPKNNVDAQTLFFKFREDVRMALQAQGENEAARCAALLEFAGYVDGRLKVFVESKEHFETLETENTILDIRTNLLKHFQQISETPKLEYLLKKSITTPENVSKINETVPKQDETEINAFAFRNIERTFLDFKREMVKHGTDKLEFTELELDKELVTKKLVVFTLPHQKLIEKLINGELFNTHFRLLFKAKFGGGNFKIHLREDEYFSPSELKVS